MPGNPQVAVLGGGSFGTVIANLIAAKGHRSTLWMRNGGRADTVHANRENPDYLPGYQLHQGLRICGDLHTAISDVDAVMVAVPSKSFRSVVEQLAGHLAATTPVVSLTKGLEPSEPSGFRLMSEVVAEVLPDNPVGVLSGPNLAREIAGGQIAGSVIASSNEQLIQTCRKLLHGGNFRLYNSHDMYGVELGGALKNVYAILFGLCAALELGENTVGMLLTRSLAEISRFSAQLGANPLTFLGLAGVGDLLVTSSSPLSRNYRVGFALGKGQALESVLTEMGQVAEGVNTLSLLHRESLRRQIKMPLVSGLYAIVYEGKTAWQVLRRMLVLEQLEDVEYVASPNA